MNEYSMFIRIITVAGISLFAFSIIALIGTYISHRKVFPRVDENQYSKGILHFTDINPKRYTREQLKIPSGKNTLTAYLYGGSNRKGLIVISSGHCCSAESSLMEMMYFTDHGWQVLLYDYTGSYESEGKCIIGYVQAPKDLDAVLNYVGNDDSLMTLPVILYGHSLGAYASAAALQYKHNVSAAIAASGFSDPMEQWDYSVKRFTGFLGKLMTPYNKMFMKIKFGNEAHLTAVDGINSVNIPVMILQGTDDEFYGHTSSIYDHRAEIINPHCKILVMDDENRHDHWHYLLSNEAIEYGKKVQLGEILPDEIDLYKSNERDIKLMDCINVFMEKATTNPEMLFPICSK